MRCKFKGFNGIQCKKDSVKGREYCIKHLISHRAHTFAVSTTFTKEKKEPTAYEKYIASPEWKAKAKEARERNRKCSLCNRSGLELHVHHRTYVRLGNEKKSDLVVLCSDCHKMFHKYYEYDGSVGCFVKK